MSAVSLTDVKAHLNMTGSGNDTELQRFIDAAETAIGHRVGPLTPESRVEKHNGGSSVIVLRSPRAVSLTSIAYADGSTYSSSDYDLDTDTGVLYLAYGGTYSRYPGGQRNVTVAYQAGWSSLPADLVQAVKELVRHLWETQRGAATGARPGFADEDSAALAGSFSSWPIRVRELLEPYTVPSVA